jgi:hypothetical protein
MLAEIVEELAYIGVRGREDGQAITCAHLRDDKEASLVLEHGCTECAPSSAEPEAIGVLRQRRRERRERLGLERRMGGMFDGKAIGAQYQHRFHSLACGQAVHNFPQTRHMMDSAAAEKSLGNVRTAWVEVKQ